MTLSSPSGSAPDAASPDQAEAFPDIGGMADVQSILQVCARVSGMGYVVIAHVTESRWVACAVSDEIGFGLGNGGELPIKTTLCNEVRQQRRAIAFDHASADPQWTGHPTPRLYGLESYIAVPIILADGAFFGTLCAIDRRPAPASRPDIVGMFELFAKLIASLLEGNRRLAVSEAALLDAHETAELRDQFIAVLGHDLRNPLAAVEAGVMLLKRNSADERSRLVLKDIARSTARMNRLINDVLDFARGRLGGGLPIARKINSRLDVSLHQVVDELKSANPERIVEVDFSIPETVYVDADRVAQLLSNLLANALAHGSAEQPVRVSARVVAEQFELTVSNGGDPIPHAVRPRLFQPFNRTVISEVREGLGLGLYIARQIALAHGGELTMSSTPEETRFTFVMAAS